MDSLVQLALAAKASQVFLDPGNLLCFPALSPYSYAPEELDFATLESPEDLRRYREFSVVVNHVVRGALYDPADERLLWDVVRTVLDQGECAGAAPGEAEQARLTEARALLYVDPDALPRIPSEAALVYARYRDAVIVAEQHLAARAGSAAFDPDPEVRARWATIEEPSLRREITALKRDWEETGKKVLIEAAREIERANSQQQASATWAQWRGQFQADIDMLTDPEGISFAPTSFSPSDIATSDDWQEIVLSQSEMNALAETADPELRRVFGSRPITDIEQVKFQCRSAKLERPWLPRDLFAARFWRLPPGAEPVSDGQTPDFGQCPAYPVAVVFARGIEVTRRVPGQAEPQRQFLHAANIFKLEAAPMLALVAAAPKTITPPPLESRLVARTRAAVVRDHRRGVMGVRHHWRGAGGLREWAVAHEAGVVSPPPPPLPPPPPAEVTINPDITILAFICRRVGLCPNPDPTLSWV